MDERKTVYYQDEYNDDFAGNNIDTKTVKSDFKYINDSWLFKFNSFLLKYLFAVPILWIVNTFFFRPKIENKKVLKNVKKKGYYLYSNHVLPFDPIVLPVKTNPGKHAVIIAGPDLFSINGFVSWLTKHFGAIPIPNKNDLEMNENYLDGLSWHIKKGHRVLIYPEAHIWPYCTMIRPLKPGAFRYPVRDNAPVIVSTTTFKKRKGNRKPKPVIYLDGPFYPDDSLPYRDSVNELTERVYEAMKYRASKEDNYSYIIYKKKGDE